MSYANRTEGLGGGWGLANHRMLHGQFDSWWVSKALPYRIWQSPTSGWFVAGSVKPTILLWTHNGPSINIYRKGEEILGDPPFTNRKLRPRKQRWVAHSHAAGEWQNQEYNQVSPLCFQIISRKCLVWGLLLCHWCLWDAVKALITSSQVDWGLRENHCVFIGNSGDIY